MSEKKRIAIYLGWVYGLGLMLTAAIWAATSRAHLDLQGVLVVAGIVFMWFPACAAIATKRMTHDSEVKLIEYAKPRFKGNTKYYLFACFVPGVLIMAGVIAYFLVFPRNLDLSMPFITQSLATAGKVAAIPTVTIPMALLACVALVIVAPFVLINHVFAFGEEIGWRGYILPKMVTEWGLVKGIVANGVLWGFGHFPLLLFGFNYNAHSPATRIGALLMMGAFACSLGIFLSYLTVKTKSVLPASIAHGAGNAIGKVGLLVCVTNANAFFGPSFCGLIGFSGLSIVGVYLLARLYREYGPRKSPAGSSRLRCEELD